MARSAVKMRSPIQRLLALLIVAALALCLIAPLEHEPPAPGIRSGFYRLRQRDSARWLGSHGADHAGRTLALDWDKDIGALTLRTARNVFLTCRGGATVFITRSEATAVDLWRLTPMPGGAVALSSLVSGRYLRLDDQELRCDANVSSDGIFWETHEPSQEACAAVGSLNPRSAAADACWWAVELADSSRSTILFGTVKPLKKLQPLNPSDVYDPFIILNRTLMNWARLPMVQPVVFIEDPLSYQLVDQINAVLADREGFSHIDIIREFEIEETYKVPTYRGLFREVIKKYPSTKAVMYANMDCLFTSNLAKTIDAVQDAYERKKESKRFFRGWYIVGRRRNVNVPVSWSMEGKDWESRIEEKLKLMGRFFTTQAEDYFIMNPELFNWSEMPPFLVGGVAFDNWLTSRAVVLDMEGMALAVDATQTLTVIHQNHDSSPRVSHLKPKSAFNDKLMEENGGMPYPITTYCPHLTRWVGAKNAISVSTRNPYRPILDMPNEDEMFLRLAAKTDRT